MKKIYMIPETVVVEVNVSQQLLAGSPDLGGKLGSGDTILEREDLLLWEDN